MNIRKHLSSALILAGGLVLASCSKISEPYYTIGSVIVDTTKRTVLLEDYTGHSCVNCAPAASTAASLQELYHGQVFVMAIHAGIYARPKPDDPWLSGDYRCPTGDDWFGSNGFNIEAVGNPRGMVNRRVFGTKQNFAPSEWAQYVKSATALPRIVSMNTGNSFNSQSGLLNTTVNVRFLENYAGKVTLTVCMLEDSIIGGQENRVPPDSIPIIKHYVFMHMLRGSLNGSYGELIATDPSTGYTVSKSYALNFNDHPWIPEHCQVLAFISDESTREVLHVIKSPVIH